MFVLTADHGAGAAMRDPMNWALPLYRLSGIQVKVHLFFFIITFPLFLRLNHELKGTVPWFELFMMTVGIVFISVLLHEYGHCFAARAVGGGADQILIWPLGGLAYVDVPHSPRAHFWTTIWGPLVNVFICIGCSIIMLAGSFSPAAMFNPFGNPWTTPAYNFDGRTYTTDYHPRYYISGTATPVANPFPRQDGKLADANGAIVEKATPPAWMPWVWRVSWINWWLFLFNMLIPAYPMDCGRLVHAALWARSDYRTATITSCYVGYVAGAIMVMISFFTNETLLVGLGIFILINCYRTLHAAIEGEVNSLGYDFSQGYTSLDRDEEKPAPAPRKQSFIRRWLAARQVRKLKSEHDSRIADDARMDELLEKIARSGKGSLTEEEHRFMARVSARYRNRSS